MAARALNGIRVVELTTAVAGPVAGHILGDMGAEVIKIEEPTSRARTTRSVAPPREGAPDRPYNRVHLFNELNRSKRLVALNLQHDAGRDIALRLVAISDVLIENFSPRVMGNLGLDYEALRAVNPSIIAVSMPAFGKSGPYRDRGSYGPGIDAMSGMSHLTGYTDRMPGKPANFFCDQNAGLHAAFCIMAALRHRRRTGEGQYIEMAMLEGELQLVAPAVMDAILNGRDTSRLGNRHERYAPHGVYPCAGPATAGSEEVSDRWVAIAVTSDAAWRALATVIGRPDLADDPRYAREEERRARQDEIDELIAGWTRGRDHYDVQRDLQAAGVAAGAVLDVAELFDDPQLQHRGIFDWVDHPEMGRFPHTRTAWRSLRGNSGVQSPAPLFGEANDYVLRELLGLPDAAIARLAANGTIADVPIGYEEPEANIERP